MISAAGGEICHRAEFCHWSFYVTAIMRITAGINKTEDVGRKDTQIGFADSLQRVFPTAVAKVLRISWLDSPGDLVRPKVSNI